MNLTLQRRTLQQTASALGRVAQIWLDPTNEWRQEAVTAIQVSTGFTRLMVEQAIEAAFEALTEPKILEFCLAESAFQATTASPEKVLHVLAGNVFTAWLPGVVVTLLLDIPSDIKPSSQETLFPKLWKRSVEQVDSELAAMLRIVPWDTGLLARYPAVVAYGSDETLGQLRFQLASGARFVDYGHKLSVAVLWKEALTPSAWPGVLERLERDVRPFNLAGCLSPQFVYLEGEDPGIFEKLFARVNVMPVFKRFGSAVELKSDLQVLVPHLSTLGFAGPAARLELIQPMLHGLGVSRVCALGEMQRPPLSWRNGGVSLTAALCCHPREGGDPFKT